MCLHPVKLFLNFGHFAAPNQYNCVMALVHFGTHASVEGLNQGEYERLLLSPKFNAKHRWREKSYVFRVDHYVAE